STLWGVSKTTGGLLCGTRAPPSTRLWIVTVGCAIGADPRRPPTSTEVWKVLWMALWTASARRFDLDVQVGDHVGVQTHRQINAAQLLQRLGPFDPPAIDLGAGLLQHCLCDVDGCDRTEEPALGTRARLDRDCASFELRSERLRGLSIALVARVPVAAHRVGLRLDALRRPERQPPRHQIVAGVPVGDVDQVTL